MKDWVHPAVRRGTVLFTTQAIGFTAGVAYIIFLALQKPTVECWWWAGLWGPHTLAQLIPPALTLGPHLARSRWWAEP